MAWGTVLVGLMAAAACSGANSSTTVTCGPGRTPLDGVCVKEQVADYVACVRAQGAQVGSASSQSLATEAGAMGVKAGAAYEVSDQLQKKYSVSDEAALSIIETCNKAAGLMNRGPAPQPADSGAPKAGPQDGPAAAIRWEAASDGQLPKGAQEGGHEHGKPLYVCRGDHQGKQPGKVFGRTRNFGYDGKEVSVGQYEVMISSLSNWIPASNGSAPPGAVEAGHEPGRKLILCRASHNEGVHPGKVIGQTCCIGWGGKEVCLGSYEVLVP
jgi:hypothetical protein